MSAETDGELADEVKLDIIVHVVWTWTGSALRNIAGVNEMYFVKLLIHKELCPCVWRVRA